MNKILIALALVLCAAVAVPAVAHQGKGKSKGKRPDVITIPDRASSPRASRRPSGTRSSSARATRAPSTRAACAPAKGAILVPGDTDPTSTPDDRGATGLKVDRHGRLFASGANSKHIRVYDSRTGEELRDYPVAGSRVHQRHTSSRGRARTSRTRGPAAVLHPVRQEGRARRAAADPHHGGPQVRRESVQRQRHRGREGRQDADPDQAATRASCSRPTPPPGATKEIAVTGGDGELANGDGIMRKGRKLFVVENRDDAAGPGVGVISVVRLSRDLTTGTITTHDHRRGLRRPDDDRPLGRPQLRRQRSVQLDRRRRRTPTRW